MTDIHSSTCRLKGQAHSDAAKRLSDSYNLHRIGAGYAAIGKWFAARLDDGKTDDVLYASKSACVRHQHHNEQYYAFVKIAPCDMNFCDAEVYLGIARRMYEAGIRMVDPDHKHGGPDLIKRLTAEDQHAMLRGVAQNLKMPWEA